jgi:hypothetical protein
VTTDLIFLYTEFMLTRVYSCAVLGLEGVLVEVHFVTDLPKYSNIFLIVSIIVIIRYNYAKHQH